MPPTPRANAGAAQSRNPDAENPVEDVRYDREYLISHCRALLKIDDNTIVAGALAAEPGRAKFSLEEAEGLVKDHLKKTIEPEAAAS